jgi:hypothetical protein
MKLIGIYIYLSKIFDKCSYWTNNRALLVNDPNNSYKVNDTYGMTEDDREYFFKEYVETVCSETSLLLSALRKKLLINGTKANNTNSYCYSYDNDRAIYYIYVNDNFPEDEIKVLLNKFIQWRVLYYWYWLKGLQQEVSILLQQAEDTKSSVKNIIGDYSSENANVELPYNDGFVVNPTQTKIDFSTITPIVIGADEVQGIIINSFNPITITEGKTYQLLYSFMPEYSSCPVTFKVLQGNSITISDTGVITALHIIDSSIVRIYKTDDETIYKDIMVKVVAELSPTITELPKYLYVNEGYKMALQVTVTACNSGTITYQWYKDSVAITDNATAQTNGLKISNVKYATQGDYYCVARETGVALPAISSVCRVLLNGIFQPTYNTQFE